MLQCQLTLYGDDERLLMVRDITRLHRLEQMRRDFVANVSHELRTPLTVLNGYLETYADHAELMPPRLASSLGQMQDQTTRMQNLVDDLLMLSRLEIDQPSADNASVSLPPMLDDILHDTESLSAGRHQVRVEIESGQLLRGDPKELRSAISNLAFNAVRYSGEGCHIVLRWRDHPAGAALGNRGRRRGHRSGTYSASHRALLPGRQGPQHGHRRHRPGTCHRQACATAPRRSPGNLVLPRKRGGVSLRLSKQASDQG